MADSDRALALDLLVIAPLPFSSDGRRTHQLGVSVFYAELLPRLADAGHRVRVLAEAPPARSGEHRAGLSFDVPGLDVDWFAFEYRSGRRPADRAYCEQTRKRLAPLIASALDEQRPDVVVIGREIVAPAVTPLCREQGLSSVVIAHGVTLAAADAADYPAEAREDLYGGLRGADRVIAVARHLEAAMRTRGVENVCAIPNAADTQRFYPEARDANLLKELGIDADEVVVAQVGSLKESKRPLDLLRACQELAPEDLGLAFLLIGDGPERAALETEARIAGLADRFRFVGEVEHSRMPEVMRLADVVVLASEREGYPLIYGEAQASARVVVASDIPAAREAIIDGETGVLFNVGDVGDLAAKLRELARDRSLRDRIGHRARAAAESWNAESVAEAYGMEFCRVVAEVSKPTR